MKKWFNNLKVAQKLMLISVFFVMPDSLMLYLFITGINANIEFARLEKKGNAYQRPLEELLELIPQHRLLAQRVCRGEAGAKALIPEKEARIEAAFKRLKTVDARIGSDLQFTEEGLAKRGRGRLRVPIVYGKWKLLEAEFSQLTEVLCAERHEDLVLDLRGMITHAGDLSNLILDPDLDSYYLMDATLLALPQTQDRLASTMAHGDAQLRSAPISDEGRQRFAIESQFLKEADLDRIRSSVQTALNEDGNFYGTSATLQSRVPPALEKYAEAAGHFGALTEKLAQAGIAPPTAQEYIAAGDAARTASFELWRIADEEVDVLLDKRIEAYEVQRARSLMVTALALLAAISFVSFITRSISGPLRQQAAELQLANLSLQAQIAERNRAEAELRRSETQLAAAQKIARIGSWEWDIESGKLAWSAENFRIHGFERREVETTYQSALEFILPQEREYSDSAFKRAIEDGQPFSFEQRILRHDGTERILHQRGSVVLNEAGLALKVFGTAQDVTERKRAEGEMERMHIQLMDLSRQAGMTEVATSVLHNVGNVLNSVNISCSVIVDAVRKSSVNNVVKLAAVIKENEADLATFFTSHATGKRLPAFMEKLAERLGAEQTGILRELHLLAENIEHIREIVAMQQGYATVGGVREILRIEDLIEDALRMNGAALARHRIDVVREWGDLDAIPVDKHKVLQILVNLVRNAKHALTASPRADKVLRIGITADETCVRLSVADNGIGIAPENMTRIFAHGFTTKKDGHGFGLHSGVLAAKEMGGNLLVRSEGAGTGATFILELPRALPLSARGAAQA